MHDLDKLLTYCKQEQIDPMKVELSQLERFATSLFDIGIGPRSLARIFSGVRSFYRFLVLDGFLETDPTELLDSPKQGLHLPEVLSTEEVDMMEAAIDLSKWEGHRNKAIIEVLFSCGLRVSELVNLKISNIYVDEQFVRVIGKGSKERLVPISKRALQEIDWWYDCRRKMHNIKPGEEDYVFLNRRGAHLTRTMILIMVKNYAKAAGINIDKTRMLSVILSTWLGAVGILIYEQGFGFVQLYMAPFNMALPAVAAILIGGASVNKASITNVIIGTFLYQGLVTMTPTVMNSMIHMDMSEVIRVIVSNGMIVYALTRKTEGGK